MSKEYDAIVIGSGVGGLVCANYLAKAGLRVIVVEKNSEPGGYCTSFSRRGFIIDTTIHAIQNCATGNILHRIFEELKILDKLRITRPNPTDTVITSSGIIHIYNQHERTLAQFVEVFPGDEKGLIEFFDLLTTTNFIVLYRKFKNLTLAQVLNNLFKSEELKAVINFFLANIGSLANETSAVSAFALLRQFILFGGYYPLGGMQTIPNALVDSFKLHGGSILFRKNVSEILVKNGCAVGIRTHDETEYLSPCVISNCDISYTYSKLLKLNKDSNFLKEMQKTQFSRSIFIVYMMMNSSYANKVETGPGIWYLSKKISEGNLFSINKENVGIVPNNGVFFSIASKLDKNLVPSSKDLIRIMVNSEYKDAKFWTRNSELLSNELISEAEKIFPDLRESLICAGRSTPATMKNYTNNSDGAMCGWRNTVENISDPIVHHMPKVEGLYFAGHWVTQPYGNGGVAMAADTGQKTATTVLKYYAKH